MIDPNEYDTDSSSGSETASDTESLSDMEYWDPSDDTYKNKRTNEKAPEESIIKMIDPNEHDADSSSNSETTSDDEFPEDIGYWDPIFDTYRSKRTNKVIPEERVTDDYDYDEYDKARERLPMHKGLSKDIFQNTRLTNLYHPPGTCSSVKRTKQYTDASEEKGRNTVREEVS